MSGAAGPSGPARSGCGCGIANCTGHGVRIGSVQGDGSRVVTRMDRTPYDEVNDLRARVAELERDLRVARFNETGQRQRADEGIERLRRWQEQDRASLGRIRALVNVQRKTLRMGDLCRALGMTNETGEAA